MSFSQIFFIPSIKINFYVTKFKKLYKDRKILIAKEITKLHEFYYREKINSINILKFSPKGELTVVISEKNIKDKIFDEKKIIKKAKVFLKKYSLKDVVELISKKEKIFKKKVYEICLLIKNEEKSN